MLQTKLLYKLGIFIAVIQEYRLTEIIRYYLQDHFLMKLRVDLAKLIISASLSKISERGEYKTTITS